MTNPLVGRGMNQPLDKRRPRVEWNHGSGGVLKNGLLWGGVGVGIIFCVYTLTNTWRGCDSWWVNPWPPGSWSVTHPTADCLLCHGPLERVPTAFWWWLTRTPQLCPHYPFPRPAHCIVLGYKSANSRAGCGLTHRVRFPQRQTNSVCEYSLVSNKQLSRISHEEDVS